MASCPAKPEIFTLRPSQKVLPGPDGGRGMVTPGGLRRPSPPAKAFQPPAADSSLLRSPLRKGVGLSAPSFCPPPVTGTRPQFPCLQGRPHPGALVGLAKASVSSTPPLSVLAAAAPALCGHREHFWKPHAHTSPLLSPGSVCSDLLGIPSPFFTCLAYFPD